MLKQYRRRFIQLNMGLVGVVLLLVLVLIGIYMYNDYINQLRDTFDAVLKPLNAYSSSPDYTDMVRHPEPTVPGTDSAAPASGSGITGQPPSPENNSGNAPSGTNKENGSMSKGTDEADSSRSSGILGFTGNLVSRRVIDVVIYEPSTGDISILSESPQFDDSTISTAVSAIVASDKSFGTLGKYGITYGYLKGKSGYRIAMTSSYYVISSMMDLMIILLGIFITAMILFYFISRHISLLAIRPLEEAMTRERQFVTDISHDLKTPLTVILANNSILRSNGNATVASQQNWIDSTEDAARNMQGLIEEMLTLSRVEAAETQIELTDVDFSQLLEGAALQMESLAYDKGIMLDADIAEDIHVLGCSDYLQRISASLIENALKYEQPGGAVTLRLTANKSSCCMTVNNRGGFISEEDLAHIFDRFYRGDKSRNTHSGHGLGLSIVNQMVLRMGGTIDVTSTREQGTTFSVTLKTV